MKLANRTNGSTRTEPVQPVTPRQGRLPWHSHWKTLLLKQFPRKKSQQITDKSFLTGQINLSIYQGF